MDIDAIYKITLPVYFSEDYLRYVHVDLDAIVAINDVTIEKGEAWFSVTVMLRDSPLVFTCGEWQINKLKPAHDQLLQAWQARKQYKEVQRGH